MTRPPRSRFASFCIASCIAIVSAFAVASFDYGPAAVLFGGAIAGFSFVFRDRFRDLFDGIGRAVRHALKSFGTHRLWAAAVNGGGSACKTMWRQMRDGTRSANPMLALGHGGGSAGRMQLQM
jgi:hypothetical protein